MVDVQSSPSAMPFHARNHALFLDFDGTLAPLQDDPDSVVLPEDGAEVLSALDRILNGALVLISGRDIRDLSARTPLGVWRAGGHGLEVCKPGEAPAAMAAPVSAEMRQAVAQIVDPVEGARIEEKGPVLAIHYRQNPEAEHGLLEALNNLSRDIPGYKAQHGKMVIELKPKSANKGRALTKLMQEAPFAGRAPIMFGDDTTDEDAMLAAAKIGGFGVKVGEGETCANYRFADPEMVWAWLRRITNEHA